MDLLASILCFVAAAAAFLSGFVDEFSRSGRVQPHEIVPSLPWALVALAFLLLGFWLLPYGIPR